MCVRMRPLLNTRGDLLQITSILSWCHCLWSGALSVQSRCLPPWTPWTLICISSPWGVHQARPGPPLPIPQLGNSLKVVNWDNSRGLQICFLSFRDHSLPLPDSQCLENCCVIYFAFCLCVCFFQAAGKICPFYSVLSGIPQPALFYHAN